MSEEKTIVAFWDCNSKREELQYETRDDAVDAYLDEIPRDQWPATVEVYGWARQHVDWPTAGEVVARITEDVDAEHGDPYGKRYDPSAKVLAAAEALLDEIRRDYTPWSCEPVMVETVGTAQWSSERDESYRRMAAIFQNGHEEPSR